MNTLIDRIHIRYFEAQDANCCFKIRSAAYIKKDNQKDGEAG